MENKFSLNEEDGSYLAGLLLGLEIVYVQYLLCKSCSANGSCCPPTFLFHPKAAYMLISDWL